MLKTKGLIQESIGCLSHFNNLNNKNTVNEVERLANSPYISTI